MLALAAVCAAGSVVKFSCVLLPPVALVLPATSGHYRTNPGPVRGRRCAASAKRSRLGRGYCRVDRCCCDVRGHLGGVRVSIFRLAERVGAIEYWKACGHRRRGSEPAGIGGNFGNATAGASDSWSVEAACATGALARGLLSVYGQTLPSDDVFSRQGTRDAGPTVLPRRRAGEDAAGDVARGGRRARLRGNASDRFGVRLRKPTWSALCLTLPPLIYGGVAMAAPSAVGIRHFLPVYPFVFIGDRNRRRVCCAPPGRTVGGPGF